MLNTDAVINFRGDGNELESVLKKLGVGFSKLNDGVSDNIDYISTLGKESTVTEKLLGKMSGTVGKTGRVVGGLGDAFDTVSDSVGGVNSALKATVKINDITGNGAVQLGAKFLGLGKQIGFLDNTLGPVAEAFTAVSEQGSAAGKIFKVIDIAQKPISSGLRTAAGATLTLAEKFESLGFLGKGVAEMLESVSGGLIKFSNAVNLGDKVGDIYRMGEGIKKFAEEDLGELVEKGQGAFESLQERIIPMVDTPLKAATLSARLINTTYGALSQNTSLLANALEKAGEKGSGALKALSSGMEKIGLPKSAIDQTNKLAIGLESVTDQGSKASRALQQTADSFQQAGLNNIASKFLGFLALKESVDMLKALGAAVFDAYMKMQGLNTAFQAMQAIGIDTSSAEMAASIGLIGEQFLLSSQAAEKFVTTSFQKFAGLQDQLANLATLSVGAAAGQEKLGQTLTDLVNGPLKNAISSVEAAKGMYNALSAGVGTIGETAKFMEAATKLSSATGAEAGTTIEALAKSMKVYKIENRDSALVAAKMNQVVERGIVTFPQLAGGIARVSESAKASGVGMDELYGSIAALTQTLSADDAMTGYASLLSSIAGQGAQSAKAIEELGIKFDTNTIKSKGLIASLQDLWKATGGSTNKLKEIIPDSLAFSTALSLMTTASKDAAQNMQDMGSVGAESLDTLFDNRRQSAAQRMTAVTNGFNEVMTDLGKRTLPAIEPGLKYLEGLLKYFQNLPEPLKDVIAGSAMLSMQFGRITEAGQSLVNIIMGVGKAYLFTRATQLVMTKEIFTHIAAIQQAIKTNSGYAKAIGDLVGVQQVAQSVQKGQVAGMEGLKAANDAVANSFGNARKALENWGNQFPIFQSAQYKAMLPVKGFERVIDSYKTLEGSLKQLDKVNLGNVNGATYSLYKNLYSVASPEMQSRVGELLTTLKGFDPAVAKGDVAKAIGLMDTQSTFDSIDTTEKRLKNFRSTILEKYPENTPLRISLESEARAIEENLTARKALLRENKLLANSMDDDIRLLEKKQSASKRMERNPVLGGTKTEIQSDIKEIFAGSSPVVKSEAEKLGKQIGATNKKGEGIVGKLLGFSEIEGNLDSVKAAQEKLAAIKPGLNQTPQILAETAAIESNLAARAKLIALGESETGKRNSEEIKAIGASTVAKNIDTAALAANDAMSQLKLKTTGKVTIATKAAALGNAVLTASTGVLTSALAMAKGAAVAFWTSMGPLALVGAGIAAIFMALQDFIPALGGAAAEAEKAEKAFLKAAGATSQLTEKQKEQVKEGKEYKGFLQSVIWAVSGTISNLYNLGKSILEIGGNIVMFIPNLIGGIPALKEVTGAIAGFFSPITKAFEVIGKGIEWFEGRARESVTILQELTEAATTPQSLIDARNAANRETERAFQKTLQYRQKLKDHDYITDEAKAIVKANQGKALSSEQLAKIMEVEKRAIDAKKKSNDEQIASLEEAIKVENDPVRRKASQRTIDDLKKETSALAEAQKAAQLYTQNLAAIVNAQADNQAASSTERFVDRLNQKTEKGLEQIQKLDSERIAKMRRDGMGEDVIKKAEEDAKKTQQVYQDSMTNFGVFSGQMSNAASASQRKQLNSLSNTYDKLFQDMANAGTVDLGVLRSNADAAMDQIQKSFDGGAIGDKFATDLLEKLKEMKGPLGENGISESILSADQTQELVNKIIAIKKTQLERSFAMDEKAMGEIRLREKQTVITAEESALRITEIQYKQNEKRIANAKEALAIIEKEGKGKDSQEYRDKQAEIVKMEQDLKGQRIEMGNQEIAARRAVLDQKLRLDEQSNRQVQLLQAKSLITAQDAADQMAGIDIEMNEKRLAFATETLEKIAALQGKNSKAYMDQQFEINKLEIELDTQRTNRETKRQVIAIEKAQKIFSNQIEAENQGLRVQINALTKIGDELGRQQKVLESRNSLLSLIENQSQASLTNLSRQIKDETVKAEIQSRSAMQQLQLLDRTQEAETKNLEIAQQQQRIANEKQQIEADIALRENQRAIADAEADLAKQNVNALITEEEQRAGELRISGLKIQQQQLQNQQLQLRGQAEIMENAREELVIKQRMARAEAEINLLLAQQAEAEARRNQELKTRQQMLGFYQQQINMVGKLTNSEVVKTAIEAKSQTASLAFLERKQALEKESAKDQERINALALERQKDDNALQLKENERLINQANLQLTQATNTEEQEMAQSRIQSLQKQREFISSQSDMISKQQEMNDRAAIELEIRQDQEKSEAKLNKLLAEQAEAAARVTEKMSLQKDLLERQKQLMESRGNFVTGELDILSKTVTKEKDKQEIARATARIKYQSLLKQQEMELRLLELNQAQQKATMEQEAVRLRMQQAQNRADIADAKSKVSEAIAKGDSPEMVRARLESLQAKVEQGTMLQYASEIQANQAKLQEALNAQQRQATIETQAVARGNSLVDMAETLPGRQRQAMLTDIRNQRMANLGLGFAGGRISGLDRLNVNQDAAGVIPQITAPDLDAIRRNFTAQMQEFAVPNGAAATQGRRPDPAIQEIRDTLQAQAERPTNDVSMQNTINITLQADKNGEVGQNVEQQVLTSLDNVLTTLNQRR